MPHSLIHLYLIVFPHMPFKFCPCGRGLKLRAPAEGEFVAYFLHFTFYFFVSNFKIFLARSSVESFLAKFSKPPAASAVHRVASLVA